jgi:hypothetical protein
MNRPEAGTVAGSHVLVKRLDSVGTRELTELLVHVVGTRARVVTDPHAEVLDLQGLLLMNLLCHTKHCQAADGVPRNDRVTSG